MFIFYHKYWYRKTLIGNLWSVILCKCWTHTTVMFLYHSSMSTGLNSMAAVVLEDFYKTWFTQQPSPRQTNILMKTVVVVTGTVCVGLVVVVEKLGTVLQVRILHSSSGGVLEWETLCNQSFVFLMQMSMSLSGVTHGASLGIFSMGLFLPWVNSKVSSKVYVNTIQTLLTPACATETFLIKSQTS